MTCFSCGSTFIKEAVEEELFADGSKDRTEYSRCGICKALQLTRIRHIKPHRFFGG
jgi:hypothetical protein